MPDTQLTAAILFVTLDAKMADPLRHALSARAVTLDVCADLETVPARIAASAADWLLLELPPRIEPEHVGDLAEQLLARSARKPRLALLLPRDEVRLRLAAMRAGAEICLLHSMSSEELAERLARLVETRRRDPERILVVDDQPVAALFAARVLQGAGMVTERVADPLRLLEALERFQPDLVLMDLHMPGASGIELTAIIRGHDRFADLPIVFLSSELDPDVWIEALRIGGDDFLAKPVAPSRLVDTVRDRLKRVSERRRHLQGPDSLDPLTRLATRERLLARLDWLIGQPRAPRLASGILDTLPPKGPRAIVYLELMGDLESLEVVAAEVAARIHPGDLAARVGERAVAILVCRASHRAIAQFAQALVFQVVHSLDGTSMGAALGGGWYPLMGNGEDSVVLLSRAAKAARLSLRRGDERVADYRPLDLLDEEAGHAEAMLEAVRAERMHVLFEPMVALGDLVGERYEMTARLIVGDGECLPPAVFLPTVARAGLAAELNRWLLRAGLDVLKTRLESGRMVLLFIHQTLLGLDEEDWSDWVREQINRRDLIRLRPVLQFDVQEADERLHLALRRVRELGKLGIRVCLDGVDFSERSMRVLHVLPVGYARISRDALHGPDAESIAWLIQSIKGCGAKVIAAGVEGPATIAQLLTLGVDLIQGPYVQPPTAVMDFEFAVQEAFGV